jgi:dTDP-4-dehydrorhamnose 3,5-epimerase
MKVIPTKIDGLLIIEPDIFRDDRGFFLETYNKDRFYDHGIDEDFLQDNMSQSSKGVLRGLHFQKPPFAQGKLVQVIAGSVLDVVVDIRNGSPTYGQWVSVLLTDQNKTQLWIPPGFAHGFLTLEDRTIFSYKCTNYYAPDHDAGILWDDPSLAIDWQYESYGITEPIVSQKDSTHGSFLDL